MSKHFNGSETKCHGNNYENYTAYGYSEPCGCGGGFGEQGTDPAFLEALDAIRDELGVPLYTSCMYRCPIHNKRVGGVDNSAHRHGLAADIQTPEGFTPQSLTRSIVAITQRLFPGEPFGIGTYSWGVHFSRGAGEGRFNVYC